MKVEVRHSFVKDTSRLPAQIKREIANLIIMLETASTLSQIPSCKKLKGYKYAYRIRIGDYG